MAGRGGVFRKVVGGNVTKVWDGFVPEECKPNRKIIRFNVAQKWEEAHEPLNYGIDCLSSCGLGPGMAFANEILKKDSKFGVIGLVPCARGGTGLDKWRNGSLPYGELVKRAKIAEKNDGIIRGLLWYHGESDVKGGNGYKDYKINLEKFIHDLRTDLNSPNLPILYGTERIHEEGDKEIKVDTVNYKKPAGHEEEEPQKEDVRITHVPLTYEKRGTGDSLAAKVAEKIESAKETLAGAAGSDTADHNKTE
ncbi:putative anaphase-promoting complex subunit cdh1-like [Capsicum annuum]|uniref:Sialate O-acetylesterase domain-containing protein n=1 Tax=Capsicum annuum TaxID=4072 RepID=A0A2G2ZRJ3_CAPAN|nr:putative anaphase-promoting complex subunit cdh1-like [Capsicum annuum]KAF3677558.1 putative anaphase-promoting complex subunit cdh1-like [Capsicum annuum]PHT84593.1 hypothetical protein T459_13036 [Capsicum annuum]